MLDFGAFALYLGRAALQMRRRIVIKDCLWLRSPNIERQGVFRPFLRALAERGDEVLRLESLQDASHVEAILRRLRATDKHILIHGLLGAELQALKPLFRERGNFSMVFIDWWNSPTWYNQRAEYLFFPMYNGIAIRLGRADFIEGMSPVLWTLPENLTRYGITCSLLRFPFALASPAIELVKANQRAKEPVDRRRLIYLPFPIAEEEVPLHATTRRLDVTSMGSTFGTWIMRDAFAPARWNFANLYRDRQRLINLIRCHEGPFRIHDRRRNYRFLSWEEYCQLIRESRLTICTGGLHRASISKFLEYTCLGTPMLGAGVPFEFPWLDQVLFPIDGLHIAQGEVKRKVMEALSVASRLSENCLNLRDKLLKLYNIHELLEMAQEQIDGGPVRSGYLKSPAPF